MLKLRFKLQKNQTSKTSEERKKKKVKIAHLCLRTCLCSKIKKTKNTLKIKKKPKKIFLFLKSISNFKISYNQISSM